MQKLPTELHKNINKETGELLNHLPDKTSKTDVFTVQFSRFNDCGLK